MLVDKLIRRHPHVFGTTKVKNVDEVWANWEKIKRAEKHGTQSRTPFRVRWDSEASAGIVARGETFEEGAKRSLLTSTK